MEYNQIEQTYGFDDPSYLYYPDNCHVQNKNNQLYQTWRDIGQNGQIM